MATTEGLLLHPAGRSVLPSSLPPSSPCTPFPRMAYLFACTVGTCVLRVHTHATHLRMHACVCARDACMRACVSCIYASMPVVPNPLTCSGQCPEFKDERLSRWILIRTVKFSVTMTFCRIGIIRTRSILFDFERRGCLQVDFRWSIVKFRRGNNRAWSSSSNTFMSDSWFTMWNILDFANLIFYSIKFVMLNWIGLFIIIPIDRYPLTQF